MKYLTQFLLLMIFVFLGEAIYHIVPLPIPASIWGLVLLFLALLFGVVKLAHIEDIAKWFLIIIPVLFVVPAVGILDTFGGIAAVWPVMLGVVVLAYFASMAATGFVADWMIRQKDKKAAHKK